MVAPRRIRDVITYLGRLDGTIRQDDMHVWVRLHTEDGPEYLAELPVDVVTTADRVVGTPPPDSLMPPYNSLMYAIPKGNVPPLSNDLKIDVSSIPVPALVPAPSS